MTDTGTHILVEAGEATLDELLKAMGERGLPVRICKGGEAVAELTPVPPKRRLLPTDPRLKVTFHGDPVKLTTADDWPEQLKPTLPERPER